MSVLIVEDSDSIRRILQALMSARADEVIAIGTGRGGVGQSSPLRPGRRAPRSTCRGSTTASRCVPGSGRIPRCDRGPERAGGRRGATPCAGCWRQRLLRQALQSDRTAKGDGDIGGSELAVDDVLYKRCRSFFARSAAASITDLASVDGTFSFSASFCRNPISSGD